MTTTGQFNSRRPTLAQVIVAIVGVLVGCFQFCDHIGLRINNSPSLPLGLYVTTKDARAQLVEFCPAEPFAHMASARGYREAGSCPDGAEPLLKPIVATSGDVVEYASDGISVNGRLLQNTAPLATDTRQRTLTPWPFGRYVVQRDTVWVASSFNPRSFDSRYFGPVQISAIRDHVRAFLIW